MIFNSNILKFTWSEKSNLDKLVIITKITIITFAAIYLLGNFEPYYEGTDSYAYGLTAIDIANGNYGITNKFLQETDRWEFVPFQWTKTIHNYAVPITSIGFPIISALAFILGGLYGLFYVGPISTIFLLIASERISCKLFGKWPAHITLVLLASNTIIYEWGNALLTESIFSFFLVIGFFCLITFFHTKKPSYVILSSIFFVICSLIRANGMIFFPMEVISVYFYYRYRITFNQKITSEDSTNSKLEISNKNFSKISLLMFVPWIVFLQP